ncbi:2Fe-2S iron-sulfur cluster binding domain-containing protein [Streptomyces sp. NPDC086777]|uniref:2Fe-2S iron-sulfur cluster-binding protein n=1 Tax=Streptomyces sp. NPDC086777 TaxID=3154866 RepID=UPI00344F049C
MRADRLHERPLRSPARARPAPRADPHGAVRGARRRQPRITPTAPVRPHQPPGPPGTGPLVTFTRSAITTPWSPAHASLLEVAEACDVPTRWSCRTGVCHTCVTPLLTGDVTCTTPPLEPPEPGATLVCCTTPTDEIVLDLWAVSFTAGPLRGTRCGPTPPPCRPPHRPDEPARNPIGLARPGVRR